MVRLEKILPDGTVRTVKPTGEIEKILPDQTRHIVTTDGKFQQIKSTGEIIETFETDKATVIKQISPDGSFSEKTILKPEVLRQKQIQQELEDNISGTVIEENNNEKVETTTFNDNSTQETIIRKDNIEEKLQINKDAFGNITSRKIINTQESTNAPTNETTSPGVSTDNAILEQEKERAFILQSFLGQIETDTILRNYIHQKYGTKQAALEELNSIRELSLLRESINDIKSLAIDNRQTTSVSNVSLMNKLELNIATDADLRRFMESQKLTRSEILNKAQNTKSNEELQKFIDDLMHTAKSADIQTEQISNQNARDEFIGKILARTNENEFFKKASIEQFGSIANLENKLKTLTDTVSLQEIYDSLIAEADRLEIEQQQNNNEASATPPETTSTTDTNFNAAQNTDIPTPSTESPNDFTEIENSTDEIASSITETIDTETAPELKIDPAVEKLVNDFIDEFLTRTKLKTYLSNQGYNERILKDKLISLNNLTAIQTDINQMKKEAEIHYFLFTEFSQKESYLIYAQDKYGGKFGVEQDLRQQSTLSTVTSFIANFKNQAQSYFDNLRLQNEANSLFNDTTSTFTSPVIPEDPAGTANNFEQPLPTTETQRTEADKTDTQANSDSTGTTTEEKQF